MKQFNKVIRTKPHEKFAEASRGEVWNKFAELGFKGEYEYEFVKDMANYYSYERLGEDPNSCFLDVKSQMKEEVEYYKKNGTAKEMQKVQEKFQYHKNIQNFISGIDWEKYSGSSPLDKAAYVTSLLSSVKGGEADSNKEIDDEKMMDIFNQKTKDTEDVFDEEEEKDESDSQETNDEGEESDSNDENAENSSEQQDSESDSEDGQENQNNQESNDGSDTEDEDQSEQESDSNSEQEGNNEEQSSESSDDSNQDDSSDQEGDSLQQLLDQQGQSDEGQESEGSQDGNGDGQKVSDPDAEWGSGWSDELNQMLEEVVEKYRDMVETSAGFNLQIAGLDPEIAAANITKEQEDMIDKLSILADRGEIKSKKKQKKISHNRMTEYSQLNTMSNISQAGMPNFMYKLATKQLMVKRPDQSSKQSLVLLIDISGSMDCRQKLEWVKAIILNRLDAVIRQEAELFIVFFEEHAFISKEDQRKSYWSSSFKKDSLVKHIKTKKDAIKLCSLDWLPRFNGGGTNIQRAITQVCECIDAGNIGGHSFGGTKPQIVVMNDGQDHIDPSFTPKYTTHGFILGQNNTNMEKMCNSSEGIYERFL